ncbi:MULTISPECIES: DUF4430 domain-containing protein [Solibacillus]|uniref:DUF4430 domain-containing protein n=1 Tax=Solibacillus merdavium TaxID=2762218 RepID=A0ABR8XI18_9BACL|nr:DUF4430 domain-containing protein [Solibacillus merdavium]MBD8031542.1 DUF4430 domain-containing protein [Solibacillus merdavium]
MKRTIRLLTVVIFVFLLAACNIQSVEQYEQMKEQERSLDSKSKIGQEQTVNQEIKDSEKNHENIKEDKSESDNEEASPPKKEETSEINNKKQPIENQEKKVEAKEEAKDSIKSERQPHKELPPKEETSNKKTATDNQKVEKPKQVPVEKSELLAEKKKTVTIAIRVDTLLKNWDKLDPALQSDKYVPKNGVILKPTTYELLSEKDTVWDVLQRATKEHKIQLEYQGANENIYNSVYIEGINHLYEFSAGELSGWMYKVNGVYPNYGCSQYVLKDGDVIEWHYTVDLGRDLGHVWKSSE